MRSRADAGTRDTGSAGAAIARARVVAEWLLRATAVALLGWYLLLTLLEDGRRSDATTSAELRQSLARWSTVSTPERVHVSLAYPPSGEDRDWLAALPASGTSVTWSGPALMPTAIAVEPRADPVGGVDVTVAAPAGVVVSLRDTVGVLDSSAAGATGLRAYVPRLRGTVTAVAGPVTARAAPRDTLTLKRLLLIGAAGWETKFVAAALEERGWEIDAHIIVSPRGDVRQGTILTIDTARYSAVLALDTTAARYGARIAEYVRTGGGLILWAPAVRDRALASVAPGAAAGQLIVDDGRPLQDTTPRLDLELLPITQLSGDAIVLERRGDAVALAARRVGPGRVIQTGYTNSWRWRMAGGEEAPELHRTWLATLVARVAYTGQSAVDVPPVSVAPLATLIDRLGHMSESAAGEQRNPGTALHWLFTVICAALLLEWSSRRLRGMR